MILLLLACRGDLDIGDSPPGTPNPDTSTEVLPDSGDPEVIDDTGRPDTDTDTDAPEEDPPDVVVDCTGAGDYATLAEAVAAVPSGTRIGVAACTYAEGVNFKGKTLDVFGMADRSRVVFDAPSGPAFTAIRGESVGTRLAHVTLTGAGSGYGNGVYADSAVVLLEDVHITGFSRTSAVFYSSGAMVTMKEVTIDDNSYSRGGYLTYLDNGWWIAEEVEADCDDAQYGIVEHEAVLMLDSTLRCADADVAIYVDGGELHVRRSDIWGGSYGIYAEDNNDTRNERVWLYNTAIAADDTAVNVQYMHLKARNDVFWGGNTGLELSRIHLESYISSSVMIGDRCAVRGDNDVYSATYNAIGEGEACFLEMTDTITGDPLFVSAPDDFHLQEGSPLIDAGDPDPDENDDDDTRNDIGRYGGPEADGPR